MPTDREHEKPATSAAALTRFRPRATVRTPIGDGPGDVVIDRRWRDQGALGLVIFFALVFGGPFAPMAAIWEIINGRFGPAALEIAYGVAWGYLVAVVAMNTTRVTIRDGWLERVRGPLPWPGARLELHRGDIVNVTRATTRNVDKRHEITSIVVDLHVETKSGRARALVGGLAERDAVDVERRIERALGIPDQPALNTETVSVDDD